MIARVFFFLLGFGLSVIGFTYVIGYLNLLTMGYSIIDYLCFISKRYECIMAIIGIIIVNLAIFKGGDRIDIRLWYSLKLDGWR